MKSKFEKFFKVFFKTILIILASLMCLIFVVWSGLNLTKYAIYDYYYSIKSDMCLNPGLNDGFIPQGIAAVEENEIYLTSGYMNDKSNSRIYITNEQNESRYVQLTKNGKKFTGHVGGIASSYDKVYLSNESKIYVISLEDVLNKDSDMVDVGEGVSVNNSASFVFTDDTSLYVGEFHDGGQYITNHPYQTEEGLHYAIVTRYLLNDLETPQEVFSVRDRVQGFAITDNNKIVLSTSYGLASTVYYIYDLNESSLSNETLDGAPVKFLDHFESSFNGPAMGEDLDFSNGKILTLTESACNKYFFGKFFFATHIVALGI